MSDTNVAQDQIKAFVERILRMKEEAKAINADIREIYLEAKGAGFDKTVLGKLVNYVEKRQTDAASLAEADAIFDLYLNAYDSAIGKVGTVRATHTHAPAKPDALAALRADPAMSIVDPTNLKNKSSNAQTIPAAAEAERSTPVDDVGSSGEANSDVANTISNEAPMEVDGASVEGATAPLSESGDILPGGALPETLDVANQPPAEKIQPETANDDRSCVSVLGGLAQSLQQQATREGGAARPLPPTTYAEPGVIVWETTPSEGVERGAISMAFGTMGQDLTVIADDLEKANAAPIVKKGKVILDGWARYMAVRNMTELDGSPVAYPVVQYAGADILTDIIKLNVEGRMLTDDQKRKIAANLARQEPSRKDDIYRAFEIFLEPA